jgi:MFS transporter, DHA1 family, inner membrane transport protein
LVTAGSVTTAIAAPLLAQHTVRFQRHHLLLIALAFFALVNGLAALATSFALLLFLRVLGSLSAALHTPQAAGTAGAIVPPERRGQAVAMVFTGWSIANVLGVPLGAFIAGFYGWRAALLFVALLSVLALLGVWAKVPKGLRAEPLPEGLWGKVLHHKLVMTLLAVTLIQSWGQFTAFTYISPIFKTQFGVTQNTISLVLAGYGFFGVLGNIAGAYYMGKRSAAWVSKMSLASMIVGLAVWSVLPNVVGAGIGVALWGFGCFAVNSAQQAQLMAASSPLIPVSLALNTSALYLGQGLGGATGALLIEGVGIGSLTVFAAVAIAVALMLQYPRK